MSETIPTPEEVAAAERRYSPGNVPGEVWIEHLRLNACVAFEVTPYRIVGEDIQVFLTRRSPNDPLFANLLHMPGTMCNGNDHSLDDAFDRLKTSELSELTIGEPEFVKAYYRSTPRGNEGVFMHIVRVTDGGKPENWHSINSIPEDTIEYHKDMIKFAARVIKSKD